MISVSPAVIADGASIDELRSIGAAELETERGAAALISEVISIVPDVVLVGRVGEVVIGYLSASVGPGTSIVHELYVRPETRGIGVGRALITAVVELADRAGSQSLESVVLPGMRASKNFFEAQGMVAQRIVVGRSLTRP